MRPKDIARISTETDGRKSFEGTIFLYKFGKINITNDDGSTRIIYDLTRLESLLDYSEFTNYTGNSFSIGYDSTLSKDSTEQLHILSNTNIDFDTKLFEILSENANIDTSGFTVNTKTSRLFAQGNIENTFESGEIKANHLHLGAHGDISFTTENGSFQCDDMASYGNASFFNLQIFDSENSYDYIQGRLSALGGSLLILDTSGLFVDLNISYNENKIITKKILIETRNRIISELNRDLYGISLKIGLDVFCQDFKAKGIHVFYNDISEKLKLDYNCFVRNRINITSCNFNDFLIDNDISGNSIKANLINVPNNVTAKNIFSNIQLPNIEIGENMELGNLICRTFRCSILASNFQDDNWIFNNFQSNRITCENGFASIPYSVLLFQNIDLSGNLRTNNIESTNGNGNFNNVQSSELYFESVSCVSGNIISNVFNTENLYINRFINLQILMENTRLNSDLTMNKARSFEYIINGESYINSNSIVTTKGIITSQFAHPYILFNENIEHNRFGEIYAYFKLDSTGIYFKSSQVRLTGVRFEGIFTNRETILSNFKSDFTILPDSAKSSVILWTDPQNALISSSFQKIYGFTNNNFEEFEIIEVSAIFNDGSMGGLSTLITPNVMLSTFDVSGSLQDSFQEQLKVNGNIEGNEVSSENMEVNGTLFTPSLQERDSLFENDTVSYNNIDISPDGIRLNTFSISKEKISNFNLYENTYQDIQIDDVQVIDISGQNASAFSYDGNATILGNIVSENYNVTNIIGANFVINTNNFEINVNDTGFTFENIKLSFDASSNIYEIGEFDLNEGISINNNHLRGISHFNRIDCDEFKAFPVTTTFENTPNLLTNISWNINLADTNNSVSKESIISLRFSKNSNYAYATYNISNEFFESYIDGDQGNGLNPPLSDTLIFYGDSSGFLSDVTYLRNQNNIIITLPNYIDWDNYELFISHGINNYINYIPTITTVISNEDQYKVLFSQLSSDFVYIEKIDDNIIITAIKFVFEGEVTGFTTINNWNSHFYYNGANTIIILWTNEIYGLNNLNNGLLLLNVNNKLISIEECSASVDGNVSTLISQDVAIIRN